MKELALALEILDDCEFLRKQGLSNEEIEGYVDFFYDNFFNKKDYTDGIIRLRVSEMSEDTGKATQN